MFLAPVSFCGLQNLYVSICPTLMPGLPLAFPLYHSPHVVLRLTTNPSLSLPQDLCIAALYSKGAIPNFYPITLVSSTRSPEKPSDAQGSLDSSHSSMTCALVEDSRDMLAPSVYTRTVTSGFKAKMSGF